MTPLDRDQVQGLVSKTIAPFLLYLGFCLLVSGHPPFCISAILAVVAPRALSPSPYAAPRWSPGSAMAFCLTGRGCVATADLLWPVVRCVACILCAGYFLGEILWALEHTHKKGCFAGASGVCLLEQNESCRGATNAS